MKGKEIHLMLGIIMAAVALLLVVMLIIPKGTNDDGTAAVYRLISENGKVILYSDDSVVSVYDDIVTDTLPFDDRKALETGIEFETLEQAERAAEDYDG